jgi:hypothetical protein
MWALRQNIFGNETSKLITKNDFVPIELITAAKQTMTHLIQTKHMQLSCFSWVIYMRTLLITNYSSHSLFAYNNVNGTHSRLFRFGKNVENIIKHASNKWTSLCRRASSTCILRLRCVWHSARQRRKKVVKWAEDDFPIKSLAKHFKIHCYRIFIVHVTPERSNTRFCLSFRLRTTPDDFNMSSLSCSCSTILILHSAIHNK